MNINNNPLVMIVEDEVSIRSFIKINLKRNNFDIIEASSGEEAISKLETFSPRIMILDIMLPGIDGFEVCLKVREKYPEIGIIILTARGQDMDKLMGLEIGADDYMVKPFNPLELIARIRAIFRRMDTNAYPNNKTMLNLPPFKLNIKAQKLSKSNLAIDLTPTEFKVIKLLMSNPDTAFTRDEILNKAWGRDFFGDFKTVDVNIRRLREKIEDDPSKPKYIETVWGIGYRWKGES